MTLATMTRVAAALGTIAAAAAIILAAPAPAWAARLVIPRSADQLIVVSSRTAHPAPPQDLATLRAYARIRPGSPWRLAGGPWPAETGSGHLVATAERREGDGATPVGVFTFGATIYGNDPDPGGLHYRYHRLVCGDWWDEDPYSVTYNRFVHVPCGVTPSFAPGSEPLWTETRAYPYFGVIDFNVRPIRAGAHAPGSGIFLHNWLDSPTEGCIALPEPRLLSVLRWLRPAQRPVIEIGTNAELAGLNVDQRG
jgi:L,D-peptidoglycan transpeptidase YkuD (ErfK/YbiS/YcfS/YnhG family)